MHQLEDNSTTPNQLHPTAHLVRRAQQTPDEVELLFIGAAWQNRPAANHLGKDAANSPSVGTEQG